MSSKSDTPAGSKPPDRKTVRRTVAFLKNVERQLKKTRDKLKPAEVEKIEEAITQVRTALDGKGDVRFSKAIKLLDKLVDQFLPDSRKGTFREYSESIFVAVVVAMLIRAFVLEAFKIPTGSMIPTLAVGDHIFVNKFIYGLRVPFTNAWFAQWGAPERGDIIVFRFPVDQTKDFIKRVVALPGDKVRVAGREVYVNGKRLVRTDASPINYTEAGDIVDEYAPMGIQRALAYQEKSRETGLDYTVIYNPLYSREPFPRGRKLEGLTCSGESVHDKGECTINPDYFFVMGDNRDNSADSREWGGVPLDLVKGKAMFIWWSRGPGAGVRWSRMGSAVH